MKSLPALVLVLLSLDACGVEQSQPAPVVPDERWGHLPSEEEAEQQAAASAASQRPSSSNPVPSRPGTPAPRPRT
jgi:hypothetical protein